MPDVGPLELMTLAFLLAIIVGVVLLVVLLSGKGRRTNDKLPNTIASPQSHPAGWYPDTEVPGGQRWWDGTAWTEGRMPPPTS